MYIYLSLYIYIYTYTSAPGAEWNTQTLYEPQRGTRAYVGFPSGPRATELGPTSTYKEAFGKVQSSRIPFGDHPLELERYRED